MLAAGQRILIALLFGCSCAANAQAQAPLDDPPAKLKRQPDEIEDKAAQSLKQYALGLLCEREDRLLEALAAYQKAAALDPSAVPVQRKLLAVYTALDRGKEALTISKRIVELDPGDAHAWLVYAEQLQNQGKIEAAVTALQTGLKHVAKDDLDLGQQMQFTLGTLQVEAGRPLEGAAAYLESTRLLKQALKEMELDETQKKVIAARLVVLFDRAGKIFTQQRRFDAAIVAFRDAQQFDQQGEGSWDLDMALVYEAQGKLDQALASVNTYLKQQPLGAQAYQLKITLLDRLGRKEEVLLWLGTAAEKNPGNVNVRLLLASRYKTIGQLGKAESVFLDLAKDHPQVEVYRGLFAVYRESKWTGLVKAVVLINKRIEQTDAKEATGRKQAKLHVNAMLAALRQDPALAKELLQVSLPLLEKNKELHPQTVRTLAFLADEVRDLKGAEAFYRASLKNAVGGAAEPVLYSGLLNVLWKQKKYEEMLKVCKEGLDKAQATTHATFYYRQSLALARLKKLEPALEAARKAIEVTATADRLGLQCSYVGLLSQAERYDQAEAECLKLLKLYKQPGDIAEIRLRLASVYSAQRNFPKAENELQLVLKADPSNVTACNDLGYLWADQGKNLREAEDLIRKALELDREQRATFVNPTTDPDQDEYAHVDSLGWVLFRQGKLEAARKELERATRLAGADGDPVVWDHLGDVCFKLGRKQEAQQHWSKALRLYDEERLRQTDPHYQDLQQKIELLKSTAP